MTQKIPILSLTFDDLTRHLKKIFGKGEYHAAAIMREIFLHGNKNFLHVKEFKRSGDLTKKVMTALDVLSLPIVEKKHADGVVKWSSLLSDGHSIESVMIPMTHHHTLCISSQVGCRMGCRFCQTGQMGFVRQLTTEEIVAQVYTAIFQINAPIRNIVFMGMGEPLDNFDAVIKAIHVLTDPRGFAFPKKFITISTAGHIPGIQKLSKSDPKGIHLAISINTANDSLRDQLMPINRKFPLFALQKTLSEYPLKSKGVLFIEYVLIKDINDTDEDADQLANYVAPLRVRINVIPFNSQAGIPYETPSQEKLERFCQRLIDHKLYVRKRATKGNQVMAACGQLGRT
ncbi:ribosomal RNA large subunit methyltransferase N [Candidatus Magnetomorum sp. HK-1]|nr:ribosomal RNA large subunit methyltransferase N [Candidatus Magnetomorum sp. HK-1]